MNTSFGRRSFAKLIALILVISLPAAQALELGALSLAHVPAHSMSSVTFSRAPGAFTAFARAVGGVAFTTTATSSDGSSIEHARYDATAPDGARLVLDVRRADGQHADVSYGVDDWILIPIARFVASDSTGAVTLFGSLNDKEQEEKLRREKDAMIANYHPALENTLIGLRLLQADMMAFEENATDLFKDHGQYILGKGETAPTDEELKANRAGFRKVNQWIERQPDRHSSYVTGDIDSKISYSASATGLKVTGEPIWYCWRKDDDKAEAAINEASATLSADAFILLSFIRIEDISALQSKKLQREASKAGGAAPDHLSNAAELATYRFIGRGALSRPANGLTLANRQQLVSALEPGNEAELARIFEEMVTRVAALEAKNPVKLKAMDVEIERVAPRIRAATADLPAIQMKAYSAALSDVIRGERGINPVVYGALKSSIRLAAVLRVAKARDPVAYQAFVDSMKGLATKTRQPAGYVVVTPTVYPRS